MKPPNCCALRSIQNQLAEYLGFNDFLLFLDPSCFALVKTLAKIVHYETFQLKYMLGWKPRHLSNTMALSIVWVMAVLLGLQSMTSVRMRVDLMGLPDHKPALD